MNLGRLEPLRTLHLWLAGYATSRLATSPTRKGRRSSESGSRLRIISSRGGATRTSTPRSNAQRWVRRWPLIAARHADAARRTPCYTFFYPEEQYHAAAIDALSRLAGMDIADVEVHLHHDADSEGAFVDRVGRFHRAPSHQTRAPAPGRQWHPVRLHPRQLGARQLTAWRACLRTQQRGSRCCAGWAATLISHCRRRHRRPRHGS